MGHSIRENYQSNFEKSPKKRASRMETRDILRQISGGRAEYERIQNIALHQSEVARHLVKSLSQLWLVADCGELTNIKELLEFAFYESFLLAKDPSKNHH